LTSRNSAIVILIIFIVVTILGFILNLVELFYLSIVGGLFGYAVKRWTGWNWAKATFVVSAAVLLVPFFVLFAYYEHVSLTDPTNVSNNLANYLSWYVKNEFPGVEVASLGGIVADMIIAAVSGNS
jgi:energy-coupling factor transporter transmembrane protein EcfT